MNVFWKKDEAKKYYKCASLPLIIRKITKITGERWKFHSSWLLWIGRGVLFLPNQDLCEPKTFRMRQSWWRVLGRGGKGGREREDGCGKLNLKSKTVAAINAWKYPWHGITSLILDKDVNILEKVQLLAITPPDIYNLKNNNRTGQSNAINLQLLRRG